MNVFISWSGEKSKAVATFLKERIPDIIQAAKPWMSAEDIGAGARWGTEVATALQETKFGIICLTAENLDKPWIFFETGALAKTLDHDTFVCPYLIHLEKSDIPKGPLNQFQAKCADENGTWDLICTLNRALKGTAISEERLKRLFDHFSPDLNKNSTTCRQLTPIRK